MAQLHAPPRSLTIRRLSGILLPLGLLLLLLLLRRSLVRVPVDRFS